MLLDGLDGAVALAVDAGGVVLFCIVVGGTAAVLEVLGFGPDDC